MAERLRCCVPFCRRTTGRYEPPTEWICADHYKLVPAKLKRLRTKALRTRRIGQLDSWLWREVKRRAIEAAGGIR